ncbi:ribosomal protein S2 [Tilletiopsis washingtonensis]|jgi:small subunit ribosomal protein S2|uniref:Ribosomal protein S2 n=1 Tax=Tilletiopsis washingtonensis TaxID=58919 RepID=A0A316Z1S6_9BASI|nr:ribosomal protein S2 [Tilletiopsis washingtonensis]PWN94918.1 ribosomal protein S2 [Tilletiopsis washingtonensis]
MGSTQTRDSAWRPHQARLSPVAAKDLTVSHLLAATAHVGHNVSSLSRAATQLVYGVRHGVAYIDLERVTLPALRRAASVVREVVRRDGVVLICGTAPGTQAAVLAAVRRLGPNGFHVTKERWLPGVLSNAPKLLARATLSGMETYTAQMRQRRGRPSDDGPRGRAPPPDPDMAQIATQELQPDVLIVLNPKANMHAIREATARGIITIAVTDTDVDPRIATYPIPANDESVRTAELIVGVLSKAGQDGAKDRVLVLEQEAKQKPKEVRRRIRPEQ